MNYRISLYGTNYRLALKRLITWYFSEAKNNTLNGKQSIDDNPEKLGG